MRRLVYLPFKASAQGLLCDGVSVQSIVDRVGTPVYVYSAQAIGMHISPSMRRCRLHAIHYALKANSTLAIVRLLRSLGSRADANSGGEITVALRAGFDPKDIVLTGVGKTSDELEMAIAKGVGTINAESAGELDRVAEVARGLNRVARVALRVNPDIDAQTHANISTGLKSNKFGVPLHDARAIYAERRRLSSLTRLPTCRIGSLITSATAGGARRAQSRWRWILQRFGFASNTWISVGDSGSAYEADR
jgi:diaminopimelate decarboxylase